MSRAEPASTTGAPDADRDAPACGPRGATTKALFCVRADLRSVPGGDAVQIERTREALERCGVRVVTSDAPRPPSGSFDVAHLFHLSRLDTFVQARSLEREGLPYVLSTIYWPTAELDARGNVGLRQLVHAVLPPAVEEAAKNAVRAVRARDDWRVALLTHLRAPVGLRMRHLAHAARVLLPNSEAEAQELRRLGGTRIRVVVNAADPPPPPQPPRIAVPARFLLSAGRVESRKNQLALVQALRGFPVPLLVVGDPGPMHRAYHRRLLAAADAAVAFVPALPRSELFSLYSAAEAHVAPAWYETPGLASLEAAAAGTRVVTTDRGCTREYFGDQAEYLDPGDRASIRAAVERALARPRDGALRDRVLREFTWERAAEQTLAAYRIATESGTRETSP